MSTRIVLAALVFACGTSLAAAQGSAPSSASKPMTTAPSSGSNSPIAPPKWVAPPSARSGDKGLPTGDNATTDGQIGVKRVK